MRLLLHQQSLKAVSECSSAPFLGRVCETPELPEAARSRDILLLRDACDDLPHGYRAYLLSRTCAVGPTVRDAFVLAPSMAYLEHGDVVRIHPERRTVTILYRRASPSNSLLVTEQCDNYCVMCSQPPRAGDDSWLIDELAEAIPLIWRGTRELGITGGEPTLLGARLFDLLDMLKRHLPDTAVHLLSNGRRFCNPEFAEALSALRHPDLMVGIPLYSDIPEEHDYVVQARGAFSETVRGILELKRLRQRVEVRCVIHNDTYARLPELATFLARNLLFVDHVALMGLEPVGFGKTNLESLWVDPVDYQGMLVEAVLRLVRAGMNVSIYGHQLCVLDERLHPYSRKSISDWKNVYFDECESCRRRSECGGFFASSTLRRSRGIRAL